MLLFVRGGIAWNSSFHDAVGACDFWAKPVVAQFIRDVYREQYRTRYSECQSRQVDQGVARMSQQVADGDGEVVFTEVEGLSHGI